MRRLVALLGLLVLATPPGALAAVTALLERNPVHADETVRLVIETDGNRGGERPDLTVLERDFAVLDTSTSTQIQIVNGRQVARTQWIVEIEPRAEGIFTVGPIPIGSSTTPPLSLTVLPATSRPLADRDVVLEAHVAPAEPYVQSQITLTLKLFLGVSLLDGSLSEPDLDDAVVERLGQDTTYESARGGRRYRVIERRYAVFPQRSGAFEIPPVQFQGRVAGPGRRGSRFNGLLDRGRPIRARSGKLSVDVRPPAGDAGGSWLPADSLSVEESWPDGSVGTRVGEPVTRVVRITARGLAGVQLPELAAPAMDGAKIYADQASVETERSRDHVIGTRAERFAIVPTRPGTLRLPALELPWWDVAADAPRVARLPAREIEVAPSPAGGGDPGAVPATADRAVEGTPAPLASASPTHLLWPGVSAALLVLWLVTVAAWWRGRGRPTAAAPPPDTGSPKTSARVALREAQEACRGSDPGAAAHALLRWGAARWPDSPPRSLLEVGARVGSGGLDRALQELDRALYDARGAPWNGEVLGHRLAELETAAVSGGKAKSPALPPLYPEQAT